MGRRIIRWLGTLMVGLLLVYVSLLIGVFAAMHQPIERFGKIMSVRAGTAIHGRPVRADVERCPLGCPRRW